MIANPSASSGMALSTGLAAGTASAWAWIVVAKAENANNIAAVIIRRAVLDVFPDIQRIRSL